jgi:multidrug efflux pump subunit AcrA (membrane-fusion protein)
MKQRSQWTVPKRRQINTAPPNQSPAGSDLPERHEPQLSAETADSSRRFRTDVGSESQEEAADPQPSPAGTPPPTRGLTRVVSIAILAGVAAFIPIPTNLPCRCQLQPEFRRFVAAPFEGRVNHASVETGDVVKRGQALATMDEETLNWELAALDADVRASQHTWQAALADGDTAAAQIAALKRRSAESRRQALQTRWRQREISSPIDGIVLQGDAQRTRGMTVTVGQNLFEVAPLDRLLVEVRLLDDDLRLCTIGQDTTVRLAAFPDRVWHGVVERIRPSSEIIDDRNVFVAELSLENQHGELRPGMMGHASLDVGRRSLAWRHLRRSWYAARRWTGY